MARKYKVEGTKDYLIFGILMLAFGVWCVQDGWFPPPRVLKRHPMEVISTVGIDGVIKNIRMEIGQEVGTNTVVATLHRDEMESLRQQRVFAKQDAQEALDRLHRSSDTVSQDQWSSASNRVAVAERAIVEISGLIEKADIRSIAQGQIVKIYATEGASVKSGDKIFGVMPSEHAHFYSFNRVAAVGCLLGALVCFLIHLRVR